MEMRAADLPRINERAEMDTFFEIIRIAMGVLSERILQLLTTILSGFLFGWVMYAPDWTRLAGAAIFTLLMIVLNYTGGKYANGNSSRSVLPASQGEG